MSAQALKWRKVADGVWKAKTGSKAGPGFLKASGAKPAKAALKRMGDAEFPFVDAPLEFERLRERIVVSVPFSEEERLYGLGLNFKRLEVQRTVRRLHSDHFGGSDNGRTHAPVPFYVSSAGYGVFVDLARYVDFYAGGSNRKESAPPTVDRFPVKPSGEAWTDVQFSKAVEISIPGPGSEIYVFAGPSPLEAVRRFNLLCGGGCLPPVWGLGFWHRVPVDFTAGKALAEAELFDSKGFPLDVLGLEPGWHSKSYPTSYEWNRERFPDPKGFVSSLLEKGVRVNLWENPHVEPASKLGKALEPLSGSHVAGWGGLVPDFSLPEAREAFAKQHLEEHLSLGVSGYKFDECDGYDKWLWPDHAQFPSGLSGEELRQLYGVLYQRAGCEAFRSSGRRSYGLARASNAGAASFPFVLYNDCYDHRDFVTALCSSSFCGVLWTPEARSSKTPEEWLRRLQTACMSPMALLNAWCDGTKPWSFEEVEGPVRETILLRMRLIPYLYSAFAKYHEDGTPPFRAMALVEGFPLKAPAKASSGKLDSTENPYASAIPDEVRDQYMIGPSLLAAPLFAGESSRKLALPEGAWYEFHTGAFAGRGPGVVEIKAHSDGRMPLFVRDGGIIPLAPASLRAPSTKSPVPLELRCYGSAPGSFELYDDDGESFACESGERSWTRLKVERDAAGVPVGSSEILSGGASYLWSGLSWRFMGS